MIIMINNLKRHITYFILASLIVTPCFASPVDAIQEIPTKIWTINRVTVDLYKKKIARKLINNRYERIGVLCATAAVVAAGGYYAFKPPVLAPVEQQLTQDNNDIIPVVAQDVRNTANILPQINDNLKIINKTLGINLQPSNPLPTISATEQSYLRAIVSGLGRYGYRMGEAALNNIVLLVLVGGLPGPINKLFGFWGSKLEELGTRVYHDSDFHWFVTTQTQAVPYFNDLERAAELLPLASDAEEREHQKDSMMWAADVLVKHLARVVSFMEYQAEKLKVINTGCSIQMQASSKYVYRHVGQFAQTLQTMLEDRNKHAEIPAYIKSFRESIRSEQDSFCVNEHAALYDISDSVA